VEMDITNGRLRRKSLSMAKVTVVTNWTALCPVGMIF
jgi:prolyl-tRNA editing enzyme YbaK/EbsC (Cys-tRNA(Pro) deacylase)